MFHSLAQRLPSYDSKRMDDECIFLSVEHITGPIYPLGRSVTYSLTRVCNENKNRLVTAIIRGEYSKNKSTDNGIKYARQMFQDAMILTFD